MTKADYSEPVNLSCIDFSNPNLTLSATQVRKVFLTLNFNFQLSFLWHFIQCIDLGRTY